LSPDACVSSVMVVAVEPSVKGCGAFGAGAVDRAVGPAAEHGADEAFCFAVGLRSARPSAQVLDAERAAGDRVRGRDVGRAVVGQQLANGHAVALEEPNGSPKEPDRRDGLLV